MKQALNTPFAALARASTTLPSGRVITTPPDPHGLIRPGDAGSQAEWSCAEALKLYGCPFKCKASDRQNWEEHWDINHAGSPSILLPDTRRFSVEVKDVKSLDRNAPMQDIWCTIELMSLKGNPGWLFGKAHVIACGRRDDFFAMNREALRKVIFPGASTDCPDFSTLSVNDCLDAKKVSAFFAAYTNGAGPIHWHPHATTSGQAKYTPFLRINHKVAGRTLTGIDQCRGMVVHVEFSWLVKELERYAQPWTRIANDPFRRLDAKGNPLP